MADEFYIRTGRLGKWVGGGTVVLFHLLLLLLFSASGFRTLYPLQQDQSFLVEFLPDPVDMAVRAIPGQEPRSLDPDPDQDVRLVQQALNTEEVQSEARTLQSTPGETGDVEVYEPDSPRPIDQRALYRSRDIGDTLAEQSSRVAADAMQAGAPEGNARQGNPEGVPSARLSGRTPYGALPLPDYNASNVSGTVVVRITVDQYGTVTNANVTQTGTTVQNRTLWDAAVKAALKAKFNVSAAAPVVQEGTITYVFTLK